jgi:hypothetical protein
MSYAQRSRKAGVPCENVTPCPENRCSTLFASAEGGLGTFCFLPLACSLGFGGFLELWLDSFALGFLKKNIYIYKICFLS